MSRSRDQTCRPKEPGLDGRGDQHDVRATIHGAARHDGRSKAVGGTCEENRSQRRSGLDNRYVRQRIARFACEAEGLKYTSFRQLTRQLRGLPPGPEGSIMKLGTTD